MEEGGVPNISFNTITGNRGVGVRLSRANNGLVLENNIITGSATGFSTILGSLNIVLGYNNIFDNRQNFYSYLVRPATDIYADPEYLDPIAGNYSLHATSPAKRLLPMEEKLARMVTVACHQIL